jgi:hypothetical protein
LSDVVEDTIASALEDFEDYFGMAVKVVVDILPIEDVISGSP